MKRHGGPTPAASSTLSLSTQYWTSRGIGVPDVNYRGTTGYGRPYRLRLEKQWGLVDVEDCVAGARWLAANRNAEPDRLNDPRELYKACGGAFGPNTHVAGGLSVDSPSAST